MLKTVSSDQAPAAIGPYSQAIDSGELLFVSGQIPLDPKTGLIVGNNIRTQTRQVIENIESILNAAGLSLADVVKTTVLLFDLTDFNGMNEVYAKMFSDHKPARATFEVSRLPKDARIEIECVAKKPT